MGTINFTNRNLNILNSFQVGPNVYSENVYIFKSATINTLSAVFNPNLFTEPYSDLINIIPPNQGEQTFYFNGIKWVYASDFVTDANNYIIPENSIIFIQAYSVTQVPVGGGAIINRYYLQTTQKGIIQNQYLSYLNIKDLSNDNRFFLYKGKKDLTNGIDIYSTGNYGRETYKIKYKGPVNTRLIDILSPSLTISTDQDAASYFNRANITNNLTKINISEFCKGLKNLNLWDNMLNVYLLNSGYNSTAGTIYGLKTGYDGSLINPSKATWTSSGIFLGSGSGVVGQPYLSSGKAAIVHPILPVFTGNFSIFMLAQTYTQNKENDYGAWWHQTSRDNSQRSIWFQPNSYFYNNEFQYGNINSGSIYYTFPPRLNTGNKYNLLSYDVNFQYTNISQYSGSGSLKIYKDGVLQEINQSTISGGISLPNLCVRVDPINYPCDMHSGFINGFVDYVGNNAGAKSQGYYSFAAAFSKVLSSGEHLSLKNLVLNTIAQNISLN